ncbi:MAG: PEP-CTERM sorting domain-containing protein [Planctomycetota bacterium]|nr:PEP-CTERM sorting domain-containing protein [Planctomycetota bacterium]
MKNVLIATLTVALLAVSAQANMSYAPFMFNALNASGAPIANGTYVMVLDLNGDGFGGKSYLAQPASGNNASAWVWDVNDLLMDRGAIGSLGAIAAGITAQGDGECYPFAGIATSAIPASYTPNVDHFYLLWFNTPYNASATGPGINVAYGVEDLGTVGTDPGDYNQFPNGGNATLHTVPEPVSAVILLVGGGLLAARRRRMGKSV